MRTPEPTDRPSSVRPAGSSSVVPLRPSTEKPTGPDDAPTIITAPRPAAPADPSLGLTPGSRLGHFEIIGAVGAGGMAAVLKARDLELGDARQLLEVRHSITRYRIELLAFHCNARPQSGRSSSTRRWLRATQFHEYALPAPHARIAAALQGGAEGSP